MSFNKTWDVEEYKTEHECDEHWELRRKFLLAHKDKFPEDRLVCLAQVFINVEILGCRYPEEVMQLIGRLSEGIADEFRERKKTKLQRTFVQASDAAESKAKGEKKRSHVDLVKSGSNSSEPLAKYSKPVKFAAALSGTLQTTSIGVNVALHGTSNSSNGTLQSASPGPWHGGYQCFNNSARDVQPTHNLQETTKSHQTTQLHNTFSEEIFSITPAARDLLAKEIILENKFVDSPASVTITRSLQHYGMQPTDLFQYTTRSNGHTSCRIVFKGTEILSLVRPTKAEARESTSEAVLEQMREFCYTIQTKARYISETVVDTQYSALGKQEVNALPDNNRGNKLLRMMGWSGGGLGKNQQGIEEPVSVQEHINRAGLGHTDVKNKLRTVLHNFARGDSENDLAFSPDFTKDERAVIHELSRKYNLKSRSHGSGDKRQLIISRKENPRELLRRLIQAGGSTEKYDVIKPKCHM